MNKIKLEQPKSGSRLVLDTLKDLGVDTIFGYPGGAVLPFYDALYSFDGLRHILARHEQGAVHEAEGYAKSTGRPGVVVVTSGPGATNVVTGIADAYMDSVPLIVLSGQVAVSGIGRDAFQEVDFLDITLPITKYNYQVRDASDIPRILTEAYYLANTGRKGPVVVDFPKNISADVVEEINNPLLDLPNYEYTKYPDADKLIEIFQGLKNAKKPLILVGGGVQYANAQEEFLKFVEANKIPVTATLLGQGIMNVAHPLYLGMAGMHGTYAANQALMETDFLLNIGSRFDDRVVSNTKSFAPNATIAHIDIDEVEINKIVNTDIGIVSDAKRALNALDELGEIGGSYDEWIEKVQSDKKRAPYYYKKHKNYINPQEVVELIGKYTDGEAIVVTDVGQHQMWAAQYYPFKNSKQLITSGGLGTMGFGIPAAIGAKIANPEKEVVLFVGDGGFQMTNQELALLNLHDIPVKIVLINNGSLGMVRQWQTSFHDENLSHSVLGNNDPNFQKLAEAYGIKHYKLTDPSTLSEDLLAIKENVPMLIEVIVSPTEKVLPMIPPGQANDKMIGVKFNDE